MDCGALLFHTCGAAAGPEELKGVKLGRIGDRYLVKGSCTQNRKSLIRKKESIFKPISPNQFSSPQKVGRGSFALAFVELN